LIKRGTLKTNLGSGGNGAAMLKKPLLELVKLHIQPGWVKSHFLSFSESKEIAYKFGEYGFKGERDACYEDKNCDYVLLEFASHSLNDASKKEVGVFECSYGSVYRNYEGEPVRILLINTVEYLQHQVEKEGDQQLDNRPAAK
jgi:hypothetical protein